MTGTAFLRVTYDMPISASRARAESSATPSYRAAQEIAENINTRLASFFHRGT